MIKNFIGKHFSNNDIQIFLKFLIAHDTLETLKYIHGVLILNKIRAS